MKTHLGYTALSSGVFFLATLIVLFITGAGPQLEGLVTAIDRGGIIVRVINYTTLFGMFTGAMATMIFRKSMNHRIYTLLTIFGILIFTEFVIISIL